MSFRLVIKGNLGFEFWSDIPGYEGLYQASTYGRIRSLPRETTGGKIIKPNTCGAYHTVCLSCGNKKETKTVHSLIAKTFLPRPEKGLQINHKDENKANNCVENLEWCTAKYNSNYGTHVQRSREHNLNHPNKSKSVFQYDLEENLIAEYPSASEAFRITGIHFSAILRCCKGEYKQMGGYKWRYA